MAELSVILPCYNESGNLLEILARYRELAAKISFQLILVDNGSTDDTPQILNEALKSPVNSFARVVRVPENVGYGHGIRAGLAATQVNLYAFSHADLQCNPEDLLTALEIYRRYEKSGPCLVKGRRRDSRPAPDRAVTWCFNHLAAWLLKIRAFYADPNLGLHDLHVCDINAEPKLFPRQFLLPLLKGPDDFTFDLYVLSVARNLHASVIEFMADYNPRSWGRSKLAANPWARFTTALKAFYFMVQLCFH